MTEQLRKQKIKALLREREAYERVGNTTGVAEVDAALRAHGHQLDSPQKAAEKRGPGSGPKSRQADTSDGDQ